MSNRKSNTVYVGARRRRAPTVKSVEPAQQPALAGCATVADGSVAWWLGGLVAWWLSLPKPACRSQSPGVVGASKTTLRHTPAA
ncbi:MAG: hypothetical protein EI684_11320 [Candidatus Viridilinea halotolerans]|uniref:Uncharacterized protein n=1 Tax=Candidatus Viridilinea halotolerans TaxID=2491704 RepID=A0A426TZF0_9CHLR|nr:MAG: hypothetical protein EI684_11320 [Candidatus Viridilinea halotolerans]